MQTAYVSHKISTPTERANVFREYWIIWTILLVLVSATAFFAHDYLTCGLTAIGACAVWSAAWHLN